MKESTIVRNAIKRLNALPQCRAEKRHGSIYTKRGTPDVSGCIRGRAFYLEGKVPGEDPDVIQNVELARWAAAGAITGVFRSAVEAVAIVEAGVLQEVR